MGAAPASPPRSGVCASRALSSARCSRRARPPPPGTRVRAAPALPCPGRHRPVRRTCRCSRADASLCSGESLTRGRGSQRRTGRSTLPASGHAPRAEGAARGHAGGRGVGPDTAVGAGLTPGPRGPRVWGLRRPRGGAVVSWPGRKDHVPSVALAFHSGRRQDGGRGDARAPRGAHAEPPPSPTPTPRLHPPPRMPTAALSIPGDEDLLPGPPARRAPWRPKRAWRSSAHPLDTRPRRARGRGAGRWARGAGTR